MKDLTAIIRTMKLLSREVDQAVHEALSSIHLDTIGRDLGRVKHMVISRSQTTIPKTKIWIKDLMNKQSK